jgi:Zn-dependent protease with chaperone function
MPFRRDLMAGTLVPGAPFVGEQINIAIKNSPFNQADEEAADCFAVDIHRKKRWSIRGGVRFFKKISTREESEDGDSDATVLDGLFSSHPDHERRIDLLNNGCEE